MADKTKRFKVAFIILALAGVVAAAYFIGRSLTQPDTPGQSIPHVESPGNQSGPGEAPSAQEDGGKHAAIPTIPNCIVSATCHRPSVR